ncbi:MAG TPA: VPLPA-CTERM sorting domain-containing protein [Steroidobacteraceae bacterium]|nr:VPLPA-CTERM sorting domain-containing protein [Steroidobacteraceae bacterium]
MAAPVSVHCPGTVQTSDREFILTSDPGAACLAYAAGNLSGNNDAINQMGYITLDKSDDLWSGALPGSLVATPPDSGLSGTFAFNVAGYTDLVIAFASGNGQLDPDWAAFSLPVGVTSGTWSITGAQDLSHVNLYGKPAPVPLPAAAWLLLSGLGMLGAVRRAVTGLGGASSEL